MNTYKKNLKERSEFSKLRRLKENMMKKRVSGAERVDRIETNLTNGNKY